MKTIRNTAYAQAQAGAVPVNAESTHVIYIAQDCICRTVCMFFNACDLSGSPVSICARNICADYFDASRILRPDEQGVYRPDNDGAACVYAQSAAVISFCDGLGRSRQRVEKICTVFFDLPEGFNSNDFTVQLSQPVFTERCGNCIKACFSAELRWNPVLP